MSHLDECCLVRCSDQNIVFTDGGAKSKMRFTNENSQDVLKYKVDNCLIKEGIRCDFLLIDHKGIEHYIELKGSDISHACKQIETTIIKLSKDYKNLFKKSFIVSSACPLTTTEIQKLKFLFKKKYNCLLYIKNKELCHPIGD